MTNVVFFNGLCEGDSIFGFSAFAVSPVLVDPNEGVCQCSPSAAEFFAIYGHGNMEWNVVHDCHADDAGRAIVQLCRQTGKTIRYRDNAQYSPDGTPADLCDYMTSRIHDEIPSYDDPESFREDDFDNHPLAALREQLVEALE